MSEPSFKNTLMNLLSQGKTSEAQAFLKEKIHNLSDGDRGQLLTEYTLTYMEVMNEVNRRYSKVLDETIRDFKKTERTEKKIDTILEQTKISKKRK